MADVDKIYQTLIGLLKNNQAEYKLFTHQAAFTYEELAAAQKQAGFFGTEMKCLVLKADDKFIVYVTLQGQKIDFDKIKEKIPAAKVRLATPEELAENFGAQPGCAYPFGFASQYDIYIDPRIYKEEWLLFSPVLPTKTVQVRGASLKRVFDNLDNHICETTGFNQ